MCNFFVKLLKMGSKKNEKGERNNFKREIGELRKELKTRETTAITQILKNADVVLSTNTGQYTVSSLRKCSRGDERCVENTCPCLQVHVMTGL